MTEEKGSILLLDDDKFLADMYSMKFASAGYKITVYLSATDAIESLKKGFDPDAILFDIVMPVHDGYSFLQMLKDEHLGERAVKIALTNQSDDAERQKATDMGADRYIVKASMIPSEVVESVADEIAKKQKAHA